MAKITKWDVNRAIRAWYEEVAGRPHNVRWGILIVVPIRAERGAHLLLTVNGGGYFASATFGRSDDGSLAYSELTPYGWLHNAHGFRRPRRPFVPSGFPTLLAEVVDRMGVRPSPRVRIETHGRVPAAVGAAMRRWALEAVAASLAER